MLSEDIIQNEVHLEDIKITNSHHYSPTLKCTLCVFLDLNYDNFEVTIIFPPCCKSGPIFYILKAL